MDSSIIMEGLLMVIPVIKWELWCGEVGMYIQEVWGRDKDKEEEWDNKEQYSLGKQERVFCLSGNHRGQNNRVNRVINNNQ